jgi:hypothetical protein
MSDRLRWRNAVAALDRLGEADRRRLLLLMRLPFLWVDAIAQLDGMSGAASVYRSLARLERAELIGGTRPPLRAGPSPRLYYLTDLGLATVALAACRRE